MVSVTSEWVWSIGEKNEDKETFIRGEKSAPLSLCPPQHLSGIEG